MDPTEAQGRTMEAVSGAMVKLHKEQFGRGPMQARSHSAGPNALVFATFDLEPLEAGADEPPAPAALPER